MNRKRTAGLAAALLALFVLLALPSPAAAQVAALVNGDPITNVDIAQRIKLVQAFNRKSMSRKEALDELINEKIKLHTANKMHIVIAEEDVDAGISRMIGGRSLSDFLKTLDKQGIDESRFKTRMRAQLAWRKVLEQGSPGVFQVRDADLVAILNAHGETPETRATQYTLQPIIFVVARRAPDSKKAARLKEAEAFRARVQGCEEAVAQARAIPETVVKPEMKKFSLDLGARYRKLLDSTPDGKMTPAEVTSAGMEVVMVCSRKEVIADISSRKEFRQELVSKRIDAFEKEYLEKLRKKSVIEIR
ncbi:MAG TPA: SurA N-terminal domain-containing protein [Xanthobacteraceae bacterium]|nr:SurA N-terminal domain-containing protein [Xanthobacteraceae bacterium]